MPEMQFSMEPSLRKLGLPVAGEQAQFHQIGMGREHGEVHPLAVEGRAKRIGRARLQPDVLRPAGRGRAAVAAPSVVAGPPPVHAHEYQHALLPPRLSPVRAMTSRLRR